MRLLSLDFESTIGHTIHGPDFRDAGNDIITQIYGYEDGSVDILHNVKGFNRKLELDISKYDIIVGHNLGFDLSYVWGDTNLRYFITNNGKIWDTQVAEYLLTGQQHAFSSLAELQLKYLGQVEKPSRISYLYKKGIGADKIVKAKDRCPMLFKLYEHYCRLDGSTPIQIYKKQLEIAKREGMLPIIELFNDYLLAICNMTCTGINIDRVKCEQTLREFNEQHLLHLQQAQDIVKKHWNDPRLPEFNINSPDHKSAVLFGGEIKVHVKEHIGEYKNGNPRFKKIEKYIRVDGFRVPPSISSPSKKPGLYSTDDGTMRKIGEKTKNPELKKYCKLQKEAMMYKKAAKTYCQAFLDRSVNGILYPNFNNTLTSTGRLSSSNPNLQNVSKRNQFGKVLHSLFVAPGGWTCVQIDFSQLEIWVLALLSKDSLLTQHLLNGTDLHIVRLQYYNPDKSYDELYDLCKVQKDPYWDKQRTFAKTVSYQMAYGAQPKKVVESTGLELQIVQTIFDKEKETYIDAASLGDKVREEVENSATISLAENIPAGHKKGKDGSKFNGRAELLPIFDKNGEILYNNEQLRRVGYYQSFLGQKWAFVDSARVTKYGINKSFSFTQPKNYPMQGTAAAIQGMTTAALLKVLIEKQDRIKMINEVHDSKWLYVRNDVLNPCLKYLRAVIEDVPKIIKERFNIDVPFNFPVDIEVGPNFGDMEKYDNV